MSAHVPGLQGRGVLYADPGDYDDVALALMAAGYTVHAIDGREVYDRASALPALAAALNLPGAADRTVEALADSLRDLPQWCADEPRIVLLWQHAEQIAEGDPDLWESLIDVLHEAHRELRADELEAVAFETVAFMEGYDLRPLRLGVGDPEPD